MEEREAEKLADDVFNDILENKLVRTLPTTEYIEFLEVLHELIDSEYRAIVESS